MLKKIVSCSLRVWGGGRGEGGRGFGSVTFPGWGGGGGDGWVGYAKFLRTSQLWSGLVFACKSTGISSSTHSSTLLKNSCRMRMHTLWNYIIS